MGGNLSDCDFMYLHSKCISCSTLTTAAGLPWRQRPACIQVVGKL